MFFGCSSGASVAPETTEPTSRLASRRALEEVESKAPFVMTGFMDSKMSLGVEVESYGLETASELNGAFESVVVAVAVVVTAVGSRDENTLVKLDKLGVDPDGTGADDDDNGADPMTGVVAE